MYIPSGEEKGNRLQYSYLENSMDRGAWPHSPWGRIGPDMTEWLPHTKRNRKQNPKDLAVVMQTLLQQCNQNCSLTICRSPVSKCNWVSSVHLFSRDEERILGLVGSKLNNYVLQEEKGKLVFCLFLHFWILKDDNFLRWVTELGINL